MKNIPSDGKYTSSRILLLSHYATTAMQDFLTLYLNNHSVRHLTVVNFPLPEIPLLTHIEVHEYASGKKISMRRIRTYVGSPHLTYVIHFLQSFWVILNLSSTVYDLVIAQNSLLAFASIFSRWIGRVRRVVFYTHGISQKRFSTSPMNSLYRALDNFVYTHSDANWALSQNIGVSREITARRPVHVVPANVPIALFTGKEKKITKPTMIFIGTLNRMNGADILPEIFREIHAIAPEFCLDIIGVGSESETIQKKLHDFHLEKHVRMLGYQDIFTYAPTLSSYFCGLAPYVSDDSSLLGSTDPMKIQVYAAAGVPAIVTDGFTFSARIRDLGLGMTAKANPASMAKAVLYAYRNTKAYRSMREQSRLYARKNDIYKIYEREFSELL